MSKLNYNIAYPENIIRELLNDNDCVVTTDMKHGLHYAMSTLDQRSQTLLLMRFREKIPYKKIGERMNMSEAKATSYITRAMRKLRGADTRKLFCYGLQYTTLLKEESTLRQARYKNAEKNRKDGVLLSGMEEISACAYTCLARKGFKTLNEVDAFISEYGPDWYMKVPGLKATAVTQVEKAIALYGLNEKYDKYYYRLESA